MLEDERAFDTTEVERRDHGARLEPQDRRGGQEVRRRARAALRPLPQDAHLRRQRPAAHVPRRPAGRHCARRFRPRRRVRPEDHRHASTARSSASASSATGPSPRSSSRSICCPPASTSPTWSSSCFLRPVKSRILFEQMLGRGTRKGEKLPRQVALHGVRLLRRHAAGVLPQGVGVHGGPADRAVPHDPGDHRRHLAEPRPRLQRPCLVKRLQRIDKEMSGEAREHLRGLHAGRRPRQVRQDLPQRCARTSPTR